MKFTLKDGTVIDLEGKEGVFLYDAKNIRYTLYGVGIDGPGQIIDRGTLMNGYLRGFKIETPGDEALPIMSIRMLQAAKSKIREGARFTTYICGSQYTIIKDSNIEHQTKDTIHRQIHAKVNNLMKIGRNFIRGPTRILDVDIDTTDSVTPSKKPKLSEESSFMDIDIYSGTGGIIDFDSDDNITDLSILDVQD